MDKEKNNNLTLFLRHYHPTRGMRLYITSGVQTLPYLQTIAIKSHPWLIKEFMIECTFQIEVQQTATFFMVSNL